MTEERSEQWRAVKGFEGLYEVSNLGRVKSVERTYKCKGGGIHPVKEKILKPQLGGLKGYEYLYVTLSKNGKRKTFGVHVLVALSFPEICGEPFEGAQCNHIDEDHFNNVPENLNWLSHPDNCNHGTRNERIAKTQANRKTVYQYTKDTHEIVKEWQSTKEVERQTGWHCGNISRCCRNCYNPKGSTHNVYKGYVWSYTQL